MTIRLQSILSIALATVVMLAGTIIALHFLLLQRFEELEHDQAQQDATRVELTLAQSIQALHSLNNDWANWNATCDFVQTEDEAVRHEYIAQNLQDPTLATNAMHAVAYLDANGGMIWSGGWHPDLESATALPQGVVDLLTTRELLRTPPEAGAYGLVLLPEGPMLISSRPVRSSEYTGPVCGTLIMGRRLDGEVLKSLRQQTQTQLSIHNGTAHEGADTTQIRVAPEQDQLRIDVPVQDIFGNPAIILEFFKPRTVMQKGREAILYAALAVTFSVVALALMIQRLLETRIMSRIRSLGQQAERLAVSGMPGQQVYLAGDDEIAGLAGSINTMLHALEESRRQQLRQLESLKEQEVFLATVLDSLQAGILQLDPQTHLILDANAFAEKVLGRSREELRGRLCHGFLCPAELGSCPVTDLGQTEDLSVRHLIDATGKRIPVLKSATLLERHGQTILLESFVDITELQAAQEQLRISEETYRTIFTSTGAALVMLDDTGKVALANEEFARMAGVSRELLEQTRPHWTRFFSSEAQPGMQTMLERAHERIANLECDFLRHDGSTRHVSFTVADLPQLGWHIISLLDVTGRRQTEAALRAAHDTLEATVAERTRELEQAVRRLKQMDAIKSSFLSSASHELRTPLTSIMGFAKLMERTFRRVFLPLATTPLQQERAAEHMRNLKIMQQEGERLTRLVNDLLDLNAIESGSMDWQEEPVHMAGLLQRVATACEATLKPEVAMRVLLPAKLPTLKADPERLRQLFTNLLSNAAKFTDQGAITLSAAVAEDRRTLQVTVADTGQGIAPDILEHIFERFYQSAPGLSDAEGLRDKPRGAGLGLAICREIVEHYGGAIHVQSTLGQGSRFVVSLPMTMETGEI
ncbi:CHASE4 domain-containing protein [Megalodesulfovibrio gigas]|uniref:histidine kinase n=1 Tax=Megalodesulfovibrio gigas (strain ATCC 19364 / DSM 1382 / NCIMB 9332 / VKM B-1759) TaxID=1121448 RepID=T2GDF2_MEGG1|nr:CHASE4 domain-containing protein [Megalodesulfovibrio gigas]AGW14343.1 putative PAS sensor protein [Megalodesulfovibrio gigas DSM 1382 = ATCC 19364]